MFEKCPCVLPDKIIERRGKKVNVKDMLHDDWPWPFNKVPRSKTTRGQRCKGKECECGGEGYMAWPPKLIKGHNVTRWENDGASSIIEIVSLKNRTVDAEFVYGRKFLAMEWNPGHPDFGKSKWIQIDWKEGMNVPGQYHPSTLQKFCAEGDGGFVKLDPWFSSSWKMITKREVPGVGKDKTGPDTVLFKRVGTRPDSLDIMYSLYSFYMGLRWN